MNALGVRAAWLPLLLGLLAANLAACAARHGVIASTTGGVFGLVRDRSSGEPLPAARVELASSPAGKPVVVALDARGAFELGGLRPAPTRSPRALPRKPFRSPRSPSIAGA